MVLDSRFSWETASGGQRDVLLKVEGCEGNGPLVQATLFLQDDPGIAPFPLPGFLRRFFLVFMSLLFTILEGPLVKYTLFETDI